MTLPIDFTALQTPCYVFDEAELRGNFSDFRRALAEHWSPRSNVAYSVKTNPFPWVLEVARDTGCYAEVVSNEEYARALEAGFPPEQIVFNGPIKGRDWLFYALDAGSYVNLDSKRELAWVREYAEEGGQARIGLRANILLEKHCPGETLSDDRHGRFGFSYEGGELARAIEEIRAVPGVEIRGLHMHVTTLSRSQKVYRTLADFAAEIIRGFNLELDWFDIGGGFYGGGPANEGAYDAYVRTIREAIGDACDPARTELLVEPGGAVVCTPGYYAGRVIDVKDIVDEHYVVTELSRINIDHEMKKTSYAHELITEADATLPRQIICGYTCMDSDRLFTAIDEAALKAGDMVVIRYAGAYSMSFTPQFFIEYPPAVYSFAPDGTVTLLREPWNERPPAR